MRARRLFSISPILTVGIWCVLTSFCAAQPAARDVTQPHNNPPNPKRLPISLDGGASINPEVLSKVQDDTLGLLSNDREAYFRILKLTEKLDPVELRTLAEEFREDRHATLPKYRRQPVHKFPAFVDLFQHPEAYRGRPVTLHGHFRRLVAFEAGKNEQGYEQLYEGWIYADDGQGNPAVVIFTDLPEGLPMGGDVSEEISVTGYFLKMYGYQAHDAIRKAPLILANTVRWRPEKPITRWSPSPQIYLAVTAAIAVIAVVISVGVRESQLRQQQQQARRAQYDNFELPPEMESSTPRSTSSSTNASSVEPHH